MFEAAPADTRQPHAVDVYVGERLRQRRKMLGYSQSQLADSIGLTFQQVQKYERGANRISASKLFEISRFLKTPIAYYFEGIGQASETGDVSDSEVNVHAFLATAEGIELAEAFPKVKSQKHRRRVVDLVKALGEE